MISNARIRKEIMIASATKRKLLATKSIQPPVSPLLNRELSLIEFFRQVLDEALERHNPLLERLRFLGIFSSIIDEFFMVRVSGLKEEVEPGWVHPSPDGRSAQEQLHEIRSRLLVMMAERDRFLTQELLPELAAEGIAVTAYETLSAGERQKLDRFFTKNVFPVLTPLAVDPAHPFPYIS